MQYASVDRVCESIRGHVKALASHTESGIEAEAHAATMREQTLRDEMLAQEEAIGKAEKKVAKAQNSLHEVDALEKCAAAPCCLPPCAGLHVVLPYRSWKCCCVPVVLLLCSWKCCCVQFWVNFTGSRHLDDTQFISCTENGCLAVP